MWHSLWVAGALVLVIEGILPFLSPRRYRQTMMQLVRLSENQLRTFGLCSMLLGLLLLQWIL